MTLLICKDPTKPSQNLHFSYILVFFFFIANHLKKYQTEKSIFVNCPIMFLIWREVNHYQLDEEGYTVFDDQNAPYKFQRM